MPTAVAATAVEDVAPASAGNAADDDDDDDGGLSDWKPVFRDDCAACVAARFDGGTGAVDVDYYTCERCGWSYTRCGSDCDNAQPRACGACDKTFCATCDVFRNTPCARCGADVCEACTAEFVRGDGGAQCRQCNERAQRYITAQPT